MSFSEMMTVPALAAYVLLVTWFAGTCAGSFLNCWAWRIVNGESILTGRSHCPECGHKLGMTDLIPVFSWFFLRGKCRYCGKRVSFRYVLAEIFCGAAFVAVVIRFGLTVETARALLLFSFLLALSMVDLESYIIPDRFIAAILIVWAATLPFIASAQTIGENEVFSHVLGKMYLQGALSGLAVGGAILLISLLFDKVTGKESLGGGDVKLFFAAGLYLGAAGGLLCVMLSCVIGLIFAAVLKKERIPFGPSIAAACMVTLMYGEPVIRWYLGLF